MPTEPRDQCAHTGPEFQISHSGQEQTSASRFLYIENSQGKKIKLGKKKKKSRIQFHEWSENFLATSEYWDDEFTVHTISSKCLKTIAVQIVTEREAQIFSITAENSSRKIKNELAKHNGWHTYPENPEPVIKTQYALCHEGGLKKKKMAISKGWHEKIP